MAEPFSQTRLEAMRNHGWTPQDVRALIEAHELALQRLIEAGEELAERATIEPGQTHRLACDLCPACWQRLQTAVGAGGHDAP